MPKLPASNRLLDALSPWGYTRIAKHLETRALQAGAVLYEVQAPIEELYFPTSGLVSLLTFTEGGGTASATLMDSRDALGGWIALGMRRSPWLAVVESPGEAQVMPADVFISVLDEEPDFRQRMLEYCRRLFELGMQSLTCSRSHDIGPRTARWLAELHDRTRGSVEVTTAGRLAAMVGSSEAAIAAVLQAFVEPAIIEALDDGRVRIVDLEALEASACDCYASARSAPI